MNVPGLKRGFHYDPTTNEFGIYFNGIKVESYSELAGRNYYVNNITGSSSNAGLSWGDAFDEVSTAVTASAAYQATQTSGNNIRNNIIIQGTSTKYTPITTMPLYTNVVGVGGNPRGHAFGIARIGSISTADGSAGDEAGNYFYNLQFSTGGSYYALDLGVSYCSTYDNCTFGCAADNEACTAGFRIATACSGTSWVDCDNLAHNGWPTTGILTAGTNLNDCRMDRCFWFGSTTGYHNTAYLCGGTVVQDCVIRGGTHGVLDESTNNTVVANIFFVNNYCYGTDSTTVNTSAVQCTNNATARCIENHCICTTTRTTEY